ncbi:MAG: phage holin family protein [Burkholderiales bacterium]
MSDAPEREPGGGTLHGALARLADALLGLARSRVELVGIEYREERDRLAQQLMLMTAAVGCLLFALFFAAAAVVAAFWDTYRLHAIVGVAIFFAVGGAVLLWRRQELANTSPLPFAATVGELEKDRAAISRTLHVPPSP